MKFQKYNSFLHSIALFKDSLFKRNIPRFYNIFTFQSVNFFLQKAINPLYSYLSTAKGVNVRWALGCKAGNPDLATPKIGSFYFPNIEV
jgi:hypothetical protein